MKTIKEAPNYTLDKGRVYDKKGNQITPSADGSVRLTIDGQRKRFKISDLHTEEKKKIGDA